MKLALIGAFAIGGAFFTVCSQETAAPSPENVAPAPSPAVEAQTTAPEVATPSSEAQPPPLDPAVVAQTIEAQVQAAFEKSKSAVVRIEAAQGVSMRAGTGFFIDPVGTICTHFSVVADADSFMVTMGDQKFPAKRLIADPVSGVAFLKVDDVTSPFLSAAELSEVKIASPVMVIGYCKDLPLGPAIGLVAGFDKTYLGGFLPTMHIRASIPVEPGQGGSPVINFKGEVVGMVSFRLDGGTSCYVLPMQAAHKIHHDYMVSGKPQYGWMGLNVEFNILQARGPRIKSLDPDSPANGIGINVGDVLVQLGDFTIESPEDLTNAAFFLTAGEPVRMIVVRNGEKVQLEARPALHPGLRENPVIVPGPPLSTRPNGESTPQPQ